MEKRLLCLSFSILILVCSVFVKVASAQNSKADRSINLFISKQARVKKGEEFQGARKIIYADLNKDGKKDAIVLYTLESFYGGNNYIQYLAVFLKTRSGSLENAKVEVVGGKNNRDVYLESLVSGKINLKTMNYLPSDASCCSSREEHSRITFSKNKWREFKSN